MPWGGGVVTQGLQSRDTGCRAVIHHHLVYSQSLRAPAEPHRPSVPDREKQVHLYTAGSQLALTALGARGGRQDHQVQKMAKKIHQQQVHK